MFGNFRMEKALSETMPLRYRKQATHSHPLKIYPFSLPTSLPLS